MIGFNSLGSYGRLGNQMFQHASLAGIAANRGLDYCIPPVQNQTDNYGLFEAFVMTDVEQGMISGPQKEEAHYHFDKELFNTCADNTNIKGYLQTEKYFRNISDKIRQQYTFRNQWADYSHKVMERFVGQDVIFLHIRRGDANLVSNTGFKWAYVNLQDHHPLQTLDYYKSALEHFPADWPVMVFSDSIDWAQEQDLFQTERFLFVEPTVKYSDGALVPYIDLCLMSLCQHAIIANSSLSWWGAWLQTNPDKKIIAPKNWFGPALAGTNTSDLYCDNWIKV